MAMSIISIFFASGQLLYESIAAAVTKCRSNDYDYDYYDGCQMVRGITQKARGGVNRNPKVRSDHIMIMLPGMTSVNVFACICQHHAPIVCGIVN